jgi:hypothetical protein
MMLLLRH